MPNYSFAESQALAQYTRCSCRWELHTVQSSRLVLVMCWGFVEIFTRHLHPVSVQGEWFLTYLWHLLCICQTSTLPWELCFWVAASLPRRGTASPCSYSDSLLCCCHKWQEYKKEHFVFFKWKWVLVMPQWCIMMTLFFIFIFSGVVCGCLFKIIMFVWIPRTYWECEVDT